MKRQEMLRAIVEPSYFIVGKDFAKLENADGIKNTQFRSPRGLKKLRKTAFSGQRRGRDGLRHTRLEKEEGDTFSQSPKKWKEKRGRLSQIYLRNSTKGTDKSKSFPRRFQTLK